MSEDIWHIKQDIRGESTASRVRNGEIVDAKVERKESVLPVRIDGGFGRLALASTVEIPMSVVSELLRRSGYDVTEPP